MKTVQDQMGRWVNVPQNPQRIISLVPSQTELLFDLGLAEQIVGLTKFCRHPADAVVSKPSIGGTKTFRFDVIEQLQPDLIIGNKEENYKEGIERLAASYPVWMSDIEALPAALAMIEGVGALVGRTAVAVSLAQQIRQQFAQLPRLPRPLTAAYLIWQKPYMVAGANTFIDDMLGRCGLVNVLGGEGDGRYPEVTIERLQALQPALLLLSSEPFPFGAKHQQVLGALLPQTRVLLVDGEMFSWYGSRLLTAVGYFHQFLSQL